MIFEKHLGKVLAASLLITGNGLMLFLSATKENPPPQWILAVISLVTLVVGASIIAPQRILLHCLSFAGVASIITVKHLVRDEKFADEGLDVGFFAVYLSLFFCANLAARMKVVSKLFFSVCAVFGFYFAANIEYEMTRIYLGAASVFYVLWLIVFNIDAGNYLSEFYERTSVDTFKIFNYLIIFLSAASFVYMNIFFGKDTPFWAAYNSTEYTFKLMVYCDLIMFGLFYLILVWLVAHSKNSKNNLLIVSLLCFYLSAIYIVNALQVVSPDTSNLLWLQVWYYFKPCALFILAQYFPNQRSEVLASNVFNDSSLKKFTKKILFSFWFPFVLPILITVIANFIFDPLIHLINASRDKLDAEGVLHGESRSTYFIYAFILVLYAYIHFKFSDYTQRKKIIWLVWGINICAIAQALNVLGLFGDAGTGLPEFRLAVFTHAILIVVLILSLVLADTFDSGPLLKKTLGNTSLFAIFVGAEHGVHYVQHQGIHWFIHMLNVSGNELLATTISGFFVLVLAPLKDKVVHFVEHLLRPKLSDPHLVQN